MPTDPAAPKHGEYDSPKSENFDVVMLKKDVLPHKATEDDIKRVNVSAEGTWNARSAPAVEAAEKEGWTILQVTKPGFLNEHERAARERAHHIALTDRTKV